METGEINITSFAAYLILMCVGAWYHWYKMSGENRVGGTFRDYLFADYPGRSVATGFVLLGAAWGSAASGLADNINPMLIYSMLMVGKLNVATVNGIVAAMIAGYGFDSLTNKGGK